MYYHFLQAALQDHPNLSKSRFRLHDTKKKGCTASMIVRKIQYFPDNKLPSDGKYSMRKVR